MSPQMSKILISRRLPSMSVISSLDIISRMPLPVTGFPEGRMNKRSSSKAVSCSPPTYVDMRSISVSRAALSSDSVGASDDARTDMETRRVARAGARHREDASGARRHAA